LLNILSDEAVILPRFLHRYSNVCLQTSPPMVGVFEAERKLDRDSTFLFHFRQKIDDGDRQLGVGLYPKGKGFVHKNRKRKRDIPEELDHPGTEAQGST